MMCDLRGIAADVDSLVGGGIVSSHAFVDCVLGGCVSSVLERRDKKRGGAEIPLQTANQLMAEANSTVHGAMILLRCSNASSGVIVGSWTWVSPTLECPFVALPLPLRCSLLEAAILAALSPVIWT